MLSAEFRKSECERPNEIIEAQCDVVVERKAQYKSLSDFINAQKADIDRPTSSSEQNGTFLSFISLRMSDMILKRLEPTP